MYSTYQQYQKRGGKLPESEYQISAQKASELIDYYTMNQAATASDMTVQLAACECDLVDRLAGGELLPTGIQSENNDGYSVTYTALKDQEIALKKVLRVHLSAPENLLVASGHAWI